MGVPIDAVEKPVLGASAPSAGGLARGPWLYRPRSIDDWGEVRTADGFLVASAKAGRAFDLRSDEAYDHRRNGTDPYAENARLIAAAPDLLVALDWLLASLEADPAAENYPGDREDRLTLARAAARVAIAKATHNPAPTDSSQTGSEQ